MSPREYSRAQRVGDQLRRELADMLVREANDPRLGAVTVSEVEVSRDLSHARIHVVLPAGADAAATLKALNKAAGYLRRGLAQRVRLRYVPELRFAHDTTLERAHRLSDLIDSAVAEDAQRARRGSGRGRGGAGGG